MIVDNDTAQKNVTRMAEKLGHAVQAEPTGDGIYLHIRGEGTAPVRDGGPAVDAAAPAGGPLVLVVPSEFMGRGEHDELGNLLVRAFFHTLGEVEPLPQTIVFFNSGVKLVAQGSPVLEDLEALAAAGDRDPGLRHLPGILWAQGQAGGGRDLQHVHHCRDDARRRARGQAVDVKKPGFCARRRPKLASDLAG